MIDLVWSAAGPPPAWPHGRVVPAKADVTSLASAVTRGSRKRPSKAVLFWGLDSTPVGEPTLDRYLKSSAHVWHAGLLLGMAGLPSAIDAVFPTWMHNCDANADIESTSWRVSLAACLARTEVLTSLGFLDTRFKSVAGASLELGHRWLLGGALVRHAPDLLAQSDAAPPQPIPIEDELRFIHRRHGAKWAIWAGRRMHAWGGADTAQVATALATVLREPRVFAQAPGLSPRSRVLDRPSKVTVLIPTLERYPWLEVMLDQLRRQTVAPHEVIVIDQTAASRRRTDLAERFADLPLRVMHLDRRGQSTARNAGLAESTGDAILFLDDDDELPADLIERHLERLAPHDVDASCGVAVEPGESWDGQDGPVRASSVFPTNNTLVRRRALTKSALFDLAYDHGIRADGDLGMRLHLSGALLVVDPANKVLHHRAPAGGLREYGMRTTTHRGSRSSYLERNKLAATEVYLARRYFTERQVNEMLTLRRLATLSRRGRFLQRLVRFIVQGALLPLTDREIARACAGADELLARYPDIPALPDAAS